jgi:alpha-glucosidase
MIRSSRQDFIVFLLVAAFIALNSASAETSKPSVALEAVTASQSRRDGVDIQAGAATLRITALRDDLLRVRIAPGSTFPEDASWAVLPAPRSKSVAVQPVQDASSVGFRTAALEVRVERNPLRLVVRDLAGNVISSDAIGRPTKFQLGGFSIHKTMPGDEHYFGLGDKAGTFDRRNQHRHPGID